MNAVIDAGHLPQGVSADGKVDLKAVARLDLEGKTVDQVYSALSSFLRKTELEPEWLSPANLMNDPDEGASGARHSRPWPERLVRDRISVSVCIGTSEGWIVHVDWIYRGATHDPINFNYSVMPLLRAKVFSSDHAWKLARLFAHQLDVA
ncbi:hypothetical protein LJR034_009238 [Caballeronia sp. LjRoot34]|uniref:hypothetical protein n=1 Tax=Caballeronia sp. LjRoot34 TaxID=3342325 RepID=UPI003ECCF972